MSESAACRCPSYMTEASALIQAQLGTDPAKCAICGREPKAREIADMTPPSPTLEPKPAHAHYFKACPYDAVDVYRVLDLFGVRDPCLQHAIKKLLVAGGRGVKSQPRDVQDAIDSLRRWQVMRDEDARAAQADG